VRDDHVILQRKKFKTRTNREAWTAHALEDRPANAAGESDPDLTQAAPAMSDATLHKSQLVLGYGHDVLLLIMVP
jgi:hypothetical protein